jgi:hypothetical protein
VENTFFYNFQKVKTSKNIENCNFQYRQKAEINICLSISLYGFGMDLSYDLLCCFKKYEKNWAWQKLV